MNPPAREMLFTKRTAHALRLRMNASERFLPLTFRERQTYNDTVFVLAGSKSKNAGFQRNHISKLVKTSFDTRIKDESNFGRECR